MNYRVPPKIHLPCGGTAFFDGDYSYRCFDCLAVVGSMGQPKHCKEEAQKWKNWEEMGGKKWNYVKEPEDFS